MHKYKLWLLFKCCIGPLVTVSSIKTWAPTPARTMGSPRLTGRDTFIPSSYTQDVFESLHCFCFTLFCLIYLSENPSSAPAKSVTYSGLYPHNTERWVNISIFYCCMYSYTVLSNTGGNHTSLEMFLWPFYLCLSGMWIWPEI